MDKLKELEELKECPICTETFQEPKVLPCIHTFCLKCLIAHSRGKEPRYLLPCPTCRKECPIPASGLVELPNNYFVQKLLDIGQLSSDQSSEAGQECDICCKVSEAVHYCFDCRQKFCDGCLNSHDKMRFNRGHKVINANKAEGPENIMKMTLSFCQKHSEEPVKYYCVDCYMVICMSCYVEEHSNHTCSSISKEADMARQQLKKDVQDVVDKSNMLEKLSNELNAYKEDLKNQQEKNISMISDYQKVIQTLHNGATESLLNEIEEIRIKKTKQFQDASEFNQRNRLIVDTYITYVNQVLENATDADLLQCYRSLQTRAEELRHIQTTTDYVPVNIHFRKKKDRIGDVKTVDQLKGTDALTPYRENPPIKVSDQLTTFPSEYWTSLRNKLYFFVNPQPTQPKQLKANTNLLIAISPAIQNSSLTSHILITPTLHIAPGNTQLVFSIYSPTTAVSEVKCATIQLSVPSTKQQCLNGYGECCTARHLPMPSTEQQLQSYTETAQVILSHTYTITNRCNTNNYYQNQCTHHICEIQMEVEIVANAETITITVVDTKFEHHQHNAYNQAVLNNISLKVAEELSMIPVTVCDPELISPRLTSVIYVWAPNVVDLAGAVSCNYTGRFYLLDRKNSVIYVLDRSLLQVDQWKLNHVPEHISITNTETLLVTCKVDNKFLEVSVTSGLVTREIPLQTVPNPPVQTVSGQATNVGPGALTKAFHSPTGSLVVYSIQANGNREISILDKDGKVHIQNIAVGLQPIDFQVDRNGCVIVMIYGTIYVFGGKNYKERHELMKLSDHSITAANFLYLDSDAQRLVVGITGGNYPVKLFQLKVDELKTITC